MRETSSGFVVIGLLVSLWTANVSAGSETHAEVARIHQEIVSPGQASPIIEVTITWLAPSSLRVDSGFDVSGAPTVSTIFRRDIPGYLILHHDTQEALIYDREQVRLMARRRQEIQQRLMDRAAEDPTGTAASLVEMQGRQKSAVSLQSNQRQDGIELVKTIETGELEGVPWTKYQETRNGVVSQELLVARWEELPVGPGVVEVFEDVGRFVEECQEISTGSVRVLNPFEMYLKLGGYPIVSRRFDSEGEIVLETSLISIETVQHDEALFANPGYPKRGVAEGPTDEESTPPVETE